MKETLRIIAAALLPATLAASLLTSAQTSPTPDAADATVRELILLPVEVQDHEGKAVRGLKQRDFILQSDGKAVPLVKLIDMTAPAQAADAPEASGRPGKSKGVFCSVPDEGMPQQLLIVAIDLANTGFSGKGEAQQQLLRYLADGLPEGPFELVAITRDGLVPIHPFTADRSSLVDALERNTGRTETNGNGKSALNPAAEAEYSKLLAVFQAPPIVGPYAWEIAARASLIALRQLAEAYAGVPGRKSVIWLTAGIRAMGGDPNSTAVHAGSFQKRDRSPLKTDPQLRAAYDEAFRALNTADMAVYPLDLKTMRGAKISLAHPIQVFVNDAGNTAREPMESFETNDGIKIFAAETGGRPCSAASDLKSCVAQAVEDSAGYYLLGFSVPRERKSGWHKLEIKLTSGDDRVRTRSRYFVPTTAAANDQEIRAYMMTAAKTGAPYSGLRFTVERMADSAHGNEGTINLRLRLPPSSIVPEPGKKTVSYEMAAVALSERGEAANAVHVTPLNLTAEQTQEARVKGWQIEEPWPATPTVTAVRYVIRDNGSGRIGSVTVPLLPRAK